MAIPHIDGVLDARAVRATGAAIARMQESSGALPWFPGGKTDPWDHVESAMALSATGFRGEAEAAYEWSRRTQRADGSWPMELRDGVVVDPGVDSNFCAYIAVGVWHHFLIVDDAAFLRRMWPTVRSALDRTLVFARDDGAFRWAADFRTGAMFENVLITGNASIHSALRCGVEIASILDEPAERWLRAADRLADLFDRWRRDRSVLDPASTHSMDWYYPVLGGVVRGDAGRDLIDSRWSDFVVDGLGARCVDDHPWVTGAETCELALAVEAIGDTDRAAALVESIQHLRDDDGSYWTGLVFSDGKRWPVEQSCWTSAAVVLAADAISGATPAGGIFRDIALGAVVSASRRLD
ncbi:prenyltransferase [Gordonia spumicola]|uniref:Prenyltransferase n=1 Tax=Gordonia spumicola TaxID=589161 RepID=A0A7I9V2Z8_9ACTN|nr:prenyltransferase [Gordonia spumicola]GED99778.1 prenyltransferase [Gordonia spumicola]